MGVRVRNWWENSKQCSLQPSTHCTWHQVPGRHFRFSMSTQTKRFKKDPEGINFKENNEQLFSIIYLNIRISSVKSTSIWSLGKQSDSPDMWSKEKKLHWLQENGRHQVRACTCAHMHAQPRGPAPTYLCSAGSAPRWASSSTLSCFSCTTGTWGGEMGS